MGTEALGEPPEIASEADGVGALFRQHREELVRLGYLLTGSSAVAEDLVQDVFVKLSRRSGAIDHPDAYLRRSVVTAVRTWQRRRMHERRHLRMEVAATVSLGAHELADALGVLGARERAVIVLHYYEGRSIDEIAEILDCPRGTVASLQSRGLSRLRKVIER